MCAALNPTIFSFVCRPEKIYKAGERRDGMYTIKPANLLTFDVFCDQTTEGEDGQCSRRDWTARLISTVTRPTINMALVT